MWLHIFDSAQASKSFKHLQDHFHIHRAKAESQSRSTFFKFTGMQSVWISYSRSKSLLTLSFCFNSAPYYLFILIIIIVISIVIFVFVIIITLCYFHNHLPLRACLYDFNWILSANLDPFIAKCWVLKFLLFACFSLFKPPYFKRLFGLPVRVNKRPEQSWKGLSQVGVIFGE